MPLTTNGLEVPQGFPLSSYEAIHKRIVASKADHALYTHYAGAWNALAYRYRASLDHGAAFIISLKEYGSTPPPEQRYLQEKLLFDFFGATFSCFESVFYALYTMGAFISPKDFDLSTPKNQQQVSPTRTRDAFMHAFLEDPILEVIQTLFNDPEYQKLRETRNVLTHRTAPGRTIYLSLGSDDIPTTEWKLNNSPIDSTIVTHSEQELSRLLMGLTGAIAKFVDKRLM